jgi:dihydropteroate synthase
MSKNTNNLVRPSIRVQGRLLGFDKPKIMGIYNLTPDSFYDGGKLSSIDKTLFRAEEDLNQGMDILDLGGYSTRPQALDIALEEEWDRIYPHLRALKKVFPQAIISIDTFRSEIAQRAVDEGADIINDISGGNHDPAMFQKIAELNVPYILMHSRGNTKTMQSLNQYDSLTLDIIDDLQEKLFRLRALNVRDIVLDPGFGFAKNISQNFELLRNLRDFQIFDLPILVGISRKSMIYQSLNIPVSEAVNGTTAVHILALERGADILRVHDVWAADQARKIWDLFLGHSV